MSTTQNFSIVIDESDNTINAVTAEVSGSITGGSLSVTGASSLTGTLSTGAVSAGGDITMADGKNIVVNSATGTKIGTAASQKLGLYGVAPVVQGASTGVTTDGFTAGSGAATKIDSTFTGDSGDKAYTIGDIVLHLKNIGILKTSA